MNGFVKVRLQSLLNKTNVSSMKKADFIPKSKVIILSPHYDDDVISCFGAMMKHYQQECELHILYITDGSASKDSGLNPKELCMIRKKESQNAVFMYFPKAKLMYCKKKDGAFAANEEVIDKFTGLLVQENYDYIYCPSITDTHNDHKQTYELLQESLKKCRLHCVVRFYEFWSPLKDPDIYIEMEGFEEKKWKSIACHKSQLMYLNYVELAKIINLHRGKQLGYSYCEVFKEILPKEPSWYQEKGILQEEHMKASLIIPAYNNEDYVAVMLKALVKQNCSFKEWEIILVDDSEDNRMKQFENWNIKNLRIIEKEHSGRAHTRNIGIRNSQADILIFMDSDIIVDKDFVQRHYESHYGKNCDISLGKVNHILNENLEEVRQIVGNNEIQKLAGLAVKDSYLNLTEVAFQNREAADYIGWVCCLFSNCSVKRTVLEKAGGFDDEFLGWGLEDIELGYRFFKKNFTFSYFENIQNYHVDHAADSDKMLIEMGQNLKRLYKKHPDEEIKSYMSFVAGFKDMQELLNDVSKRKIKFDSGSGVYFKPLDYAKSKA